MDVVKEKIRQLEEHSPRLGGLGWGCATVSACSESNRATTMHWANLACPCRYNREVRAAAKQRAHA